MAYPSGLAVADERPAIAVRFYSAVPLESGFADRMFVETDYVLHTVPIRIHWINKADPAAVDTCAKAVDPSCLTIRLLATALPQASRDGLGITSWSEEGSMAAIFYDRARDLYRPGMEMPRVLGGAMAHEICHLLLPRDRNHCAKGLLRAHWSREYFRAGNNEITDLPDDVRELMRREVIRRASLRRESHARQPAVRNLPSIMER